MEVGSVGDDGREWKGGVMLVGWLGWGVEGEGLGGHVDGVVMMLMMVVVVVSMVMVIAPSSCYFFTYSFSLTSLPSIPHPSFPFVTLHILTHPIYILTNHLHILTPLPSIPLPKPYSSLSLRCTHHLPSIPSPIHPPYPPTNPFQPLTTLPVILSPKPSRFTHITFPFPSSHHSPFIPSSPFPLHIISAYSSLLVSYWCPISALLVLK